MKYSKPLLALTFAAVFLASCSKDVRVNPASSPFELYIDFWNPQGNNPQIAFDEVNSSPEVKIDFTKTFTGVAVPPNLTNVLIENVRIIDELGVNYRIQQINAYEWREDLNDWKQDVEFVMKYDQVQDLAVVLVLDASASLGSDFGNVKAFAKDFIAQTLSTNPSARFGIVSFSDQIGTFGLSNNQQALNDFIDGMEQGPFTTMYEAMSKGIDMLLGTTAESKAVLTFTDGTDNNSKPQYTPSFIIDRLNSDPSGIEISSFTIGLNGNGGVDKPVLEQLAANGGKAAFPNSVNELGEVFDRFSESISTVYNLTYIRNQQIITENNPAKLRFVLESSPRIE